MARVDRPIGCIDIVRDALGPLAESVVLEYLAEPTGTTVVDSQH